MLQPPASHLPPLLQTCRRYCQEVTAIRYRATAFGGCKVADFTTLAAVVRIHRYSLRSSIYNPIPTCVNNCLRAAVGAEGLESRAAEHR